MSKSQNSVKSVNEIFTCKVCKKYLKNPVMLPCGEAICNQHVDLETPENEINYSIYKCQICNENHKAFEYGFCSNETVIDLLKLNSHLDEKSKQMDDTF